MTNTNISYLKLLNIFETFSSSYLGVNRFGSDFYEQLSEFTSKDEAFPILYVAPDVNTYNENTNNFTVRLYCVDRMEKDRSNVNEVLSMTDKVLNDLVVWINDNNFGVDINLPVTSIPINNPLMDNVIGRYMDINVFVPSYGECEIPFISSPVISGYTCDIYYTNEYLTCNTLNECPTIINIENDIINIENDIINIENDIINIENNYLPLAGGTMTTTADITVPGGNYRGIKSSNANGLRIDIGTGNFDDYISNRSYRNFLLLGNTYSGLYRDITGNFSRFSTFTCDDSSAEMYWQHPSLLRTGFSVGSNGIFCTDNGNKRGIQYAGDYTSTYQTNSVVHKGYIDAAIDNLLLDDLTDVTISGATNGEALLYNGTEWVNGPVATSSESTLGIVFDGFGGVIIANQQYQYLIVPFNCTIDNWSIVGDVSGNIEIDIWRANNAIPILADSIVNSNFITLAAQQINTGLPTGWTSVNLLAGDILNFNVNSSTTITKATLTLKITK